MYLRYLCTFDPIYLINGHMKPNGKNCKYLVQPDGLKRLIWPKSNVHWGVIGPYISNFITVEKGMVELFVQNDFVAPSCFFNVILKHLQLWHSLFFFFKFQDLDTVAVNLCFLHLIMVGKMCLKCFRVQLWSVKYSLSVPFSGFPSG